jgi:VWFA-related protein
MSASGRVRLRGRPGSRWPAAGAALVLGAAVLAALRPPAAAQDARPGEQDLGKPLQYEVSVVLKLIQVAVVDKKGRPVGDLEKDDFLVYDNGRPVEITAFERHAIHPGPVAPEARPATPAAPARTVEDAPALNRKIFILFDFAFNNPRGIGKAKEAALSFLDTKVRPEDEVAVLTYTMVKGVRVQEYLTRDHAKVREIIDSIDRREAAGRASEIEERFWREATEGSALPRESAATGGGRSNSEYSWERQEAKRIAQVFILRLTDLAKALRYVQGRKDFLFFSSGVPSSMIYGAQAGSAAAVGTRAQSNRTRFDAGDHVLRDQNETLLKEFATADCAFYAFDTREAAKVASLFTYDEETFASGYRDLFSGAGVFGDQTSVFKDEQFTGRNSLQRLSQTTGGKYFGNIDSYDRSLDQVQDLTGTYYVLGFSVPEKEDGVFHDVRVEVKTKSLEVRGASGYYNPKPFQEFNDLERKLHLFDLALNERAFSRLPERFPMAVLPVSLSDRSGLIVLGRVPRELAAKLSGGPLEFISLVLDEKDNIHDMQRIEAASSAPAAFLFRAATEAGPGRYRCRVVIRNTVTGLAAVSSAAATAIEARSGNLKIQPPLVFADRREPLQRLTAAGGRSARLIERTGPYPLDADDLVPVLDAVGTDRELTVVVACEVAGGGADLQVNARLAGSAGGETVTVPFFLRGRDRIGQVEIVRLGIPAGSLGPGSYNLYLFLQEPVSGETAYGRLLLNVTGR